MDLEKTINLIVDDLQINAMPYETYVYEVKATHQIIRKHLTEQLNISSVRKSSPLIEGKTKSNVKNNTQIGRLAPPPPPIKR